MVFFRENHIPNDNKALANNSATLSFYWFQESVTQVNSSPILRQKSISIPVNLIEGQAWSVNRRKQEQGRGLM